MMKQRKSWIALLMILLVFAACKGETPTAPPAGGDGGGGTTPVENSVITLTASTTAPRVNGTVVITATVTLNGQPVPNGTAVQFTSNNTAVEFADTEETTTIRTTTNGVATATVSSAVATTARITAAVNNVSRSIDITWTTVPPCVPPDPLCTNFDPTITSVTPNVGRPSGGERIRITGTNFKPTVRVVFDLGNGQTRDAFVESSTTTEIIAITPSVNLGAGQQLAADVIVLTQAGTGSEFRVVANDAFTFRNEQLTPVIYSITPNSGPIDGGTRVTILGEGFQTPVQVLFGSAEARVVKAEFSQIIVEAPPARLTNPNGSGTVVGPVVVTVVNMTANRRVTMDAGFRYISKMQITGIQPLFGSALGTTDVVIDGIGFDSKVQVIWIDTATASIRLEWQVLRVSGTQLLVRATPYPSPCVGDLGTVTVNNLDNGDTDTYGNAENEGLFRYIGVPPVITSVVDSDDLGTVITPGERIQLTVDDPGTGPLGTGTIRFQILGNTIIPSPATTTDPDAPVNFGVTLPLTGFTFPMQTCTTGGGLAGTQPLPASVPITFTNASTFCSAVQTITVTPPDTTCVPLPPIAAQTTPAAGGCATAPAVAVGGSSQATITFRNNAIANATPLSVAAGTPDGANAGEFSIAPASQSIPGQQTRSFTVTFTPGVGATGTRAADVVFTTNDPTNPLITVCLRGSVTP